MPPYNDVHGGRGAAGLQPLASILNNGVRIASSVLAGRFHSAVQDCTTLNGIGDPVKVTLLTPDAAIARYTELVTVTGAVSLISAATAVYPKLPDPKDKEKRFFDGRRRLVLAALTVATAFMANKGSTYLALQKYVDQEQRPMAKVGVCHSISVRGMLHIRRLMLHGPGPPTQQLRKVLRRGDRESDTRSSESVHLDSFTAHCALQLYLVAASAAGVPFCERP